MLLYSLVICQEYEDARLDSGMSYIIYSIACISGPLKRLARHSSPSRSSYLILYQLRQHFRTRVTLCNTLLCARPFLVLRQFETQRGATLAHILAPTGSAEVIFIDFLTCYRVGVVEGDHPRIGPEHLLLEQLVRAQRILGVRDLGKRDVILLGV